MKKIPVTVVIPVKNEAKNMDRCMQLVSDFDQILVIDSQSTDATCSIAESYGAEVHQFHWDGQFPKKRNWVLRNLELRNEWILFLDADEYLTPEFRTELQEVIQSQEYNGYWIRFINYFMGQQLKHGDPFQKLPLIRKGTGEYERIKEDSWSHLDMEVHEHPVLEGKVGVMKAPIIHNDFKGLEHYIAKHNAYSSWEAQRFLTLKKEGFVGLNKRQRFKYQLMERGWLPMVYFLGAYIGKLGFLDGKVGYYFSKYKAHYFLQIQTKIKELQS
ncbi:glycosyl transferase, group 2 family [Zunongwangia profunda SM-A87]|uniref:Glycosyl transferase, group 2 family n=1 Tax=Zunongwangia profunda (strain DSM 18752 / CCTCC AB 206139 / SM-A87) TaxID=655815 RepID=D5BFH4_ZUNPS|nr:glycosyltransferase family 2 protein [Zunongwangia profunda]ADF50918.1 glycosyl transferase, group 2 family [Zunongwangia profunda SM-A87]